LYPYIFQNQKSDNVFIGTCISGELHEIGVRMLSDLLELEGWDTYYLGANMPIDSIIKTIIEKKAKVIGLSATMTFHAEKVENQIKAIKDSKECRDVKIIVGGYVFKLSKNLWKKVGADALGEDLTDSLVTIWLKTKNKNE
jgi:methanogenic corrinoid protein MtbC1